MVLLEPLFLRVKGICSWPIYCAWWASVCVLTVMCVSVFSSSGCTALWEGAYSVPSWATSCWWSLRRQTTGCSTDCPAASLTRACGDTAWLANATRRPTASVSARHYLLHWLCSNMFPKHTRNPFSLVRKTFSPAPNSCT